MHDGSAGKIENSHLLEPASLPPDPVAKRIIDQGCPEKAEKKKTASNAISASFLDIVTFLEFYIIIQDLHMEAYILGFFNVKLFKYLYT